MYRIWFVTLIVFLCLPCLVAAQPLDSIWVSNSASNTMMKIQRGTASVVATITVPAGRPVGVTVRADGDMWVAIQQLAQVHVLDTQGKVVGTFPAGGRPTGMGTDLQGNVWCGTLTSNFMKFSPTGIPTTVTLTGLTSSQNMTCDSLGDVWLGDGGSKNVYKVSPTGTVLLTLLNTGHRTPVVDHNDNIFTTGFGSTTMKKWANDGTPIGTYNHGISSQQGLAVDVDNNLWLANQSTNILKYSNAGTPLGTFSTGGSSLLAVGVDGMSDIWVSNYASSSITQMKRDGTILKTVPVGSSPIPIGDHTGFQRAVFTDPFGDVDKDGHYNNAEAVSGSNCFDSASMPCSLSLGGTQKPGGKATLDYVDFGNRAGFAYAMACSLSQIGSIQVGMKRRIDLTPDSLFFLSFQAPAMFQNFIGILDGSGRGVGTLLIPNIPALKDLVVYCAALTVDPTAMVGVRTISPTVSFKVQ